MAKPIMEMNFDVTVIGNSPLFDHIAGPNFFEAMFSGEDSSFRSLFGLSGRVDQKLKQMAELTVQIFNQYIAQGGTDEGKWKELSLVTLYLKEKRGFNAERILVASGGMSDQPRIKRTGTNNRPEWVVEFNKGGLLMLHEYGAVIAVTEKMRDYLHYQGVHLSRSKTHITIPPRPLLGPLSRRMQKEMISILANNDRELTRSRLWSALGSVVSKK